jgi:hypothetical protein
MASIVAFPSLEFGTRLANGIGMKLKDTEKGESKSSNTFAVSRIFPAMGSE